jgi:hypothetical protein
LNKIKIENPSNSNLDETELTEFSKTYISHYRSPSNKTSSTNNEEYNLDQADPFEPAETYNNSQLDLDEPSRDYPNDPRYFKENEEDNQDNLSEKSIEIYIRDGSEQAHQLIN